MRVEVLGPDQPHMSRSLNTLAERSQAQGCSAEAPLISQRALGMREQAGGLNHLEMVDHASGLKWP